MELHQWYQEKQWLGFTFQQVRGRRRENSAEDSEAIRNLGFSLVESENLEASMVCERLKRGCGQVWPEDLLTQPAGLY